MAVLLDTTPLIASRRCRRNLQTEWHKELENNGAPPTLSRIFAPAMGGTDASRRENLGKDDPSKQPFSDFS